MSPAPPPVSPVPFWKGVIRYESAKVSPWPALRNAIGVAVPLAIGTAMGHATSGLIGATGALNVSFSDGSDPYPHRLRRLLRASLFCALAVLAGGFSGREQALATSIAGACAFFAGMIVALGAEATDIANIALVTLIVFSAQSMTTGQALASALAALGGGLLQTILSLGSWPFRRYEPERRVLAALYLEIARSAPAKPRVMEAPPASAEATQAHVSLAGLAGNQSIEAERYLALLSQAERLRLTLLTLARLRVRLAREQATTQEAALLERCLELAGRVLTSVGECLQGRDLASTHLHPREFEELRRAAAGLPRDARGQVQALAGQLRAALELASHSSEEGLKEFQRHEASQPWRLRIGSAIAVLRANLNLESAVFRHAVRLAVSITLAEIIAHRVGWGRPYWIPMTVAIVLRPDFTTTLSRGVLRVAGTLIGLGVSTGLFHWLHPAGAMEVLWLGLFAFLLRCFGPANYGVFAINLTALVVLMFAMTGVDPGPVIAARGLNTILGGAIAMLAYQVWPTWERSQAPEALARMLDAYRMYFQAVRNAWLDPEPPPREELDRTRQAGRLARSNAEASVARLAAEPGSPATRVGALSRILANAHRFIHAAMSLEAGVVRSPAIPSHEAFRTFSNHVDATLYFLAAALRGGQYKLDDLPDLREDQRALVEAGADHPQRYELVNAETDRITNSLNTLAREISTGRDA